MFYAYASDGGTIEVGTKLREDFEQVRYNDGRTAKQLVICCNKGKVAIFAHGICVQTLVAENEVWQSIYTEANLVWVDDEIIVDKPKGSGLPTLDPPTPCYYMVHSPQGGPASFQHTIEDNAQKEAIRLANKCPGKTFNVLKTVYSYKLTSNPRVVDLGVVYPNDEIPF
jgi:hypothetical protein